MNIPQAAVWQWMATTSDSVDSAGRRLATVILCVSLAFSLAGVTVNGLALYAVRANRRTVLIPWLVFQLLVIIGEDKVFLFICRIQMVFLA